MWTGAESEPYMPENSQEYWDRIGGSVLEELERRLSDGNAAENLPGTLLMRLAEQYLRYLDKKAQEQEDAPEYMTAMEAIDQPGLPADAKIQILKDYLDKLDNDRSVAAERLKELEDETAQMLKS